MRNSFWRKTVSRRDTRQTGIRWRRLPVSSQISLSIFPASFRRSNSGKKVVWDELLISNSHYTLSKPSLQHSATKDWIDRSHRCTKTINFTHPKSCFRRFNRTRGFTVFRFISWWSTGFSFPNMNSLNIKFINPEVTFLSISVHNGAHSQARRVCKLKLACEGGDGVKAPLLLISVRYLLTINLQCRY